MAQAALGLLIQQNTSSSSPWTQLKGLRLNHTLQTTLDFILPSLSKKVTVVLDYDNEADTYDITIGSQKFLAARLYLAEKAGDFVTDINGVRCKCTLVSHGESLHLFSQGVHSLLLRPEPAYLKPLGTANEEGDVLSPMPCKISQVLVTKGQQVKKGQSLFVLEAMKMEHVIRAPRDAVIEKIVYKVGDMVGEKKKLVVFVEE